MSGRVQNGTVPTTVENSTIHYTPSAVQDGTVQKSMGKSTTHDKKKAPPLITIRNNGKYNRDSIFRNQIGLDGDRYQTI